LLVGQLNTDMIATLQSSADKTDFEIEIMETDKDHVHFLIRYIPRLSISTGGALAKARIHICNLAKAQNDIVKRIFGQKKPFGRMATSFAQSVKLHQIPLPNTSVHKVNTFVPYITLAEDQWVLRHLI
jgi:hypothetical protein